MKRLTALILAIIFIFFTVGCRKNPKDSFSSGEELNSGIIKVDISDDDSSNSDNSSSDNTDSKNESDLKDGTESNSNNSNNTKPQNNTTTKPSTSSGNSSNGSSNQTSGSDTADNSNSSDTEKDEEYKKIECRTIDNNDWKKVELVIKSNKFTVRLNIPTDWEISEDGTIKRNNVKIGTITTTTPLSSVATYEESQRGQDNDTEIKIKQSTEKYTVSESNKYERHYKISRFRDTGAFNLYLSIDYAQLDSSASQKLYNSIAYIGIERTLPEMNKASKTILIFGTNYISPSYSKIDSILGNMLASRGDGYTIDTNYMNNANLSDIVNNNELLQKIKEGKYAYVFLCGFHEYSNIADIEKDLNTIIIACKEKNTGLILFPTFEESSAVITPIFKKYENLYCIDLKTEIENLINSGVGDNSPTQLKRENFVTSDGYSTPLAGYVGAHMIYRNVFGSIPPALTSDITDLTPLGDYPLTGIIPGQHKVTKYYI